MRIVFILGFLFSFPIVHSENEIQFLGHSSFRINLSGLNIVTDPVYSKRYSVLTKRVIPEPDESLYESTQIVLISHSHPDHLNLATLSKFKNKDLKIICSPVTQKYLKKIKGVKTLGLNESYSVNGVEIFAVVTKHPPSRHSIINKTSGGSIGFVIKSKNHSIYYTGDTELFEGIKKISTKFKPQICLANVNVHLPPKDVVKIFDLFKPVKIIPAHYGAYKSPMSGKGIKQIQELEKMLGESMIKLSPFQKYDL